MYTFKTLNENIAFSAIYCDCCKHKWTATKYVNKDGKWIKTDFYKRFDTLDELKKFVENYEEAENRYYFSEDNRESLPEIMDKTFTENQLKEVYRDVINKEEYHDFQEWFFDMLRSGLILYIKEEAKMPKLTNKLMNVIAVYMDDETREKVHLELAPGSLVKNNNLKNELTYRLRGESERIKNGKRKIKRRSKS